MNSTVTHDGQRSRFELAIDGEPAGVLDYRLDGSVADLVHTEVRPEFGGRGLGTLLVRTALHEARARGWTIIPTCSFVRDYVTAHPDTADLVASPITRR